MAPTAGGRRPRPLEPRKSRFAWSARRLSSASRSGPPGGEGRRGGSRRGGGVSDFLLPSSPEGGAPQGPGLALSFHGMMGGVVSFFQSQGAQAANNRRSGCKARSEEHTS